MADEEGVFVIRNSLHHSVFHHFVLPRVSCSKGRTGLAEIGGIGYWIAA